MSILVTQNIAAAPIGVYGDYLKARGISLQTWLPLEQTMPPPEDYGGLIILGGTMNACEDAGFPHLQQVVNLICQFRDANKPILGICLGAQLIARAFGKQVYPNPVPELGFTRIYPVDNGAKESFLQNCPPDLHMMQWHFDTFELPEGAELLMSSEKCRNQFYRIGPNIYGVQFHPEVTTDIIRSWSAFKTPWVEETYPSLTEDIEAQIKNYWLQSTHFAEQIVQAWLTQLVTH